MKRKNLPSLLILISLLCTLLLSACSKSDEPEQAEQAQVTVIVRETVVEKEIVEATMEEIPMAATASPSPTRTAAAPGAEEIPAPAPTESPADMFFADYGVNPQFDTQQDHLSTFAIDVDTASYSLMRRYLRDGLLPPPESVRVEEYVNYFQQGYAAPTEDAFAIYLDGSPAPFGAQDEYLLRVGIQGYQVPPEQRKDAALIFVIDVSGSMNQGNRLGLVKQSLRLLLDQLRPSDSVGLVVYGSRGRVVLEPTSASHKSEIMDAIERLQSEGSTNAEEGLVLGYQMAAEHFLVGGVNRIILCSDGVANVGNTGPDAILEQVRERASQGIYLSTVGFGMGNYNDVLMEQLANDGDGNYAYVDTLDEAQRIFVENLGGTLQVIAKDAKIQVDFNSEVVSHYRLLGYENRDVADEDFRNDDVDAGEIGAGHNVTALYEIKFHQGAQGTALTTYVRYEDPDTGEIQEISRSLERGDLSASFEQTPPYFRLAAAVAEYAEILRQSYWAEGSSLGAVAELAAQVAAALPNDPDAAEFAELVEQARRIAPDQ